MNGYSKSVTTWTDAKLAAEHMRLKAAGYFNPAHDAFYLYRAVVDEIQYRKDSKNRSSYVSHE